MDYVKEGMEYVPDNLFASTKIPVKTAGVKLNVNQGTLKRGTVIALDTSKKGNIADKTHTDDVVYGVLTDDTKTDEATGYVVAEVYLSGDFNAEALIFAEGTTLDDYRINLRELGIYTGAVMEG